MAEAVTTGHVHFHYRDPHARGKRSRARFRRPNSREASPGGKAWGASDSAAAARGSLPSPSRRERSLGGGSLRGAFRPDVSPPAFTLPRMRPLVYATRRSMLALAQCRAFVARLRAAAPAIDARELQVVTSGDRIQDRPLSEVGGKGLFVKEIEEALLDRRADFAVHSMKDLPAALPPELVLACVPAREDARDVLVAPRHGTLEALPPGARVGTSSLRRAVSLRAHRPDLQIVPLRGNVDTRLRKVDAGECDAIVLARAGLVRLGLEARATHVLSLEISLPAPGQGALGIECRHDDTEVRAALAPLHDPVVALCIAAERGVLLAVEGDCKSPLGAHAQLTVDSLRLRAFVARPDGTELRRGERVARRPETEAEAHALGLDLGRDLAS
jgi:hydroxymethylbilane synthase